MARTRVTLKDVAKRVGVHLSTVSRAVNPNTRSMVRADVAEKVLAVVREMGYQTNPFAHSLRTNKSYSVGILIPDISNPIFPPMIRGIEKTLAAAGFTAMLADSDEDPKVEALLLDQMRSRQVDGLILATAHRADDAVRACEQDGVPFVLLNRTVEDESVYSVTNNDAGGVQQAVDHVLELGHRRIAHLAGPQDLSTGQERCRGFETTMAKHGLDADLIFVGNAFSQEEGARGIAELLDRGKPFTAVIAGNDMMALGCYDEMEARGLDCPGDISVIGFNDMPFVDKFRPPMTTVRIPYYDMGVKAAEILLDILEGARPPHSVRYRPDLIIRGSTAIARKIQAQDP